MPKIEDIFVSSIGIDRSLVNDGLEYGTVKEWDSVAHMALVSALEQEYGIMLETDDVIDMSSVGKAKEILRKYGVEA